MNKVCERGTKEGGELVVDHIKPKDKGRTNDINNGQTLCRGHNLMKKNSSQTEAGKKYFIKIYKRTLAANDRKMIGSRLKREWSTIQKIRI